MNPATYAPMYAALYPSLAEIARTHGWALAVHGTLGRDMDLICVPWIEAPSEPAEVVREITNEFNIRTVGEPDTTHHGRERWMISIGFGECFLDLSFTPTVKKWQPIETAPKTSKAILIHCAERKNTYTAIWARDPEYPWSGKWKHFPGDYLTEVATHWMPLPEAPNTQVQP